MVCIVVVEEKERDTPVTHCLLVTQVQTAILKQANNNYHSSNPFVLRVGDMSSTASGPEDKFLSVFPMAKSNVEDGRAVDVQLLEKRPAGREISDVRVRL